MTYKDMNAKEITSNSKNIIYKGCLIGGVIGAGFGFILSPRARFIPGMNLANTTDIIAITVAGAILGAFIGTVIGLRILRNKAPKKNLYK